ncbi:MAG: hypothetical protein E7449_01390 [Ruminococcaceae bacterium]|nr:hypothetical protein [Oscillospiraceae bacterium]
MTTDEMVIKLTEVESRSKSNGHRIDKLEDSMQLLHKLTEAVAVMAHEQQMQTQTIHQIEASIAELKARPGKNWDKMIERVAFGVAATGLGAVLTAMLSGLLGT